MTIRVVVVDDHRVFREGLLAVLDGEEGVAIVADFGDAEGALDALPALSADVVLMDLHLPGMSGVAATKRIVAELPGVGVLVLSMLDDSANVLSAIQAGARGYLVKSSGVEDILRGVQAVHSGQLLLGPVAAGHLAARSARSVADVGSEFTPRELQLLELVAEAATTSQIAARLGISSKTVRNYLANLYPKLRVEDRSQAVLAARQRLGR